MSLLLVGAGLVLLSTFFVGSPLPGGATTAEAEAVDKAEPETPVVAQNPGENLPERPVGGRRQAEASEKKPRPEAVDVPEDKRLRITVPAMSRIRNDVIPYASATDEDAFRNYAGVHLRGTGNPWNEQANVYIAGHRLGFPGTNSWLSFWDLNVLEKGDRIFITDSEGKRYVYEVFKVFVVGPNAVSV